MVARFETATLLRAARVVATARIMRALIALWRGILGRRKISAALRASTAPASTTPTKASSAAITTAIPAEILPAAIIAIVTAWTRVFLRGIVLPKILWSGGVRLRLSLFRFALRRVVFIDLAVALGFHRRGALVLVREVRMHGLFVGNGLLRSVVGAERGGLIGAVRIGERLAWQGLDKGGRGR
jgi:hypothetical protein